jgi:hypothetical protein
LNKIDNILELLTFVGAIMSFEAVILWQLFKLSKGYKLLMSYHGQTGNDKNQILKEVRRIRFLLEGDDI